VKNGDRYTVYGGGGTTAFVADVTADVQRLIDEATKELREERDALLAENERLGETLAKAADLLRKSVGFDIEKWCGDRPER
jgi:hypothetical protein